VNTARFGQPQPVPQTPLTDKCDTVAGFGEAERARMQNRSNDLLSPGRAFVDHLIRLGLLRAGDRECLPGSQGALFNDADTAEAVGMNLVQAGRLTQYQLDRVLAGSTHGLVLGYYRVLDRIGAGGMGVVFLAEHMMLQRRVALKVLPVDDDCPPILLERFYTEMRVLAALHHPNIIMAFDSGKLERTVPGQPGLLYLAMELIDGCDLEQYVMDHGPAPIAKACRWISDAAGGLQEAHNHTLVHRDVKPSNILLTKSEQVKLVDFGLVRQFGLSLTDPKSLLGTVEFMPPEQSCDPTSVGSQADIYALGATLFWLLTGEPPYPRARSLKEGLELLQTGRPRDLCQLRPDAPAELEALIDRLLDRDPMRRPALPLMVQRYLAPFTTETVSCVS
jgi:eukaryotic-like serine/threonine-protein kinase